jgi:hypothetical protein
MITITQRITFGVVAQLGTNLSRYPASPMTVDIVRCSPGNRFDNCQLAELSAQLRQQTQFGSVTIRPLSSDRSGPFGPIM